MIARSLETRLVKLEVSRRRPNELLVVWRRPGNDVMAAASEAKFAPGDRVIVLEWFGDGPLPEPRWHDKGFKLDSIEHEYLYRADGTWTMLPEEKDVTRGRWRIEGNQYFSSALIELPHESRYTIILISKKYFVLGDEEGVFYETRGK